VSVVDVPVYRHCWTHGDSKIVRIVAVEAQDVISGGVVAEGLEAVQNAEVNTLDIDLQILHSSLSALLCDSLVHLQAA